MEYNIGRALNALDDPNAPKPGGRGTTKSMSKILLKRQKNCQRESLNSLFMVADPFSKKSFCTAVIMMFAPLQSSTLWRRPGRSEVRLACRQKLLKNFYTQDNEGNHS